MTTSLEDKETLKSEEEGLPILGIFIAATLILLPALVCVSMKVIATKCPQSSLGRKLNACKTASAMSEE